MKQTVGYSWSISSSYCKSAKPNYSVVFNRQSKPKSKVNYEVLKIINLFFLQTHFCYSNVNFLIFSQNNIHTLKAFIYPAKITGLTARIIL